MPRHASRFGSVLVSTNARLHLGFLDPGASLGRRFGSLGLTLDYPGATVELAPSSHDRCIALDTASQWDLARARGWLAHLQETSGLRRPLALTLRNTLAPHTGLGSGTQLALAIGRAFAEFHSLSWSAAQIAALLGRGMRSGIGIAGFEQGGLLVDGGSASATRPPPLLARCDFPAAWRIVLVQDRSLVGLHGDAEREAIRALPPFPARLAAELCHRVLMQVLPAAIERDFAPFAEGVSHIQAVIGDYFAPAQGGRFSSPRVEGLMNWMAARAPAAIGQSSWGPTGFAILPSCEEAGRLLQSAREAGVTATPLHVRIVGGNNDGARVSASCGQRDTA